MSWRACATRNWMVTARGISSTPARLGILNLAHTPCPRLDLVLVVLNLARMGRTQCPALDDAPLVGHGLMSASPSPHTGVRRQTSSICPAQQGAGRRHHCVLRFWISLPACTSTCSDEHHTEAEWPLRVLGTVFCRGGNVLCSERASLPHPWAPSRTKVLCGCVYDYECGCVCGCVLVCVCVTAAHCTCARPCFCPLSQSELGGRHTPNAGSINGLPWIRQ